MTTATDKKEPATAGQVPPVVQQVDLGDSINTDPIGDIRAAVAKVLRAFNVANDHKTLTDAVVDELPDFFRATLNNIELEVGDIVSVDFEPEGGDGSKMEVAIALPQARIGAGKVLWSKIG